MTDERWSRLREIFDSARDLPPAERPAYLDRELRDEPTLRSEVEALLRAESGSKEFLAPAPEEAGVPASVGPYAIRERLGEGGFGVVHRAEQLEPLRREVALKFIKPGMDTREVIARFDAERQALALMEHPAIARVFDAGRTDSGRPYFVMELVAGAPITRFCDEARLSIRERIELFLEVCDAVHHAHQKGVIHRDLKPSNVLVGRRDGAPAPKIIDFGIAKATSVGLGEHTLATRRGAVLGTLGAMSPEQAGAIAAAVDTRSDVYSLGVMLYELLAGEPPFDSKRLRSMTWTEAIRVIREEDPPRLPARYTASLSQDEIAARRHTNPRDLARALRGDLEWITQRALEKEPARRYASVSELAADLRRSLANETVLAGAPSRMHRLRKFIRRHRVGVAAAAVVVVALLTGGVVAAVGYGRAVRAERKATREAEVARRVSEFLVTLFEKSRPDESGGAPVTAKELLDEGARLIDEGLEEDPEVRASLLTTMGRSYLHLEHFDAGLPLLEKAVAVAESSSSRDPELVAFQLVALANGKVTAGEFDGVPELLDRATRIASAAGKADPAWLASVLYDQATLLSVAGNARLADSVAARGIEFAESSTETNQGVRARLYMVQGQIAFQLYDLLRAERALLRSLEVNAGGDKEASIEAGIRCLLANLYSAMGDPEKSLAQARAALDLANRIFSPNHTRRASALVAMGRALRDHGDLQEAIKELEAAAAIFRSASERGAVFAEALRDLAIVYTSMRKFDEAIERAEEAVRVSAAEYGETSAPSGEALAFLATMNIMAGRPRPAESSLVRAIDILARENASSISYPNALMNLGTLYRGDRRYDLAESSYARAEATFDSSTVGTREFYGMCLTNRGYLRSLRGLHDEAESLMTRGMAIRRGDRDESFPDLAGGFIEWAASRALAGDAPGAKEKLRLAAACGSTLADIGEYPELLAMRGDPDFPLPRAK